MSYKLDTKDSMAMVFLAFGFSFVLQAVCRLDCDTVTYGRTGDVTHEAERKASKLSMQLYER